MSDPVVVTDNQGHQRVKIGESSEMAAAAPADNTSPQITADWWGMWVKNAVGVDVIEIGSRQPSGKTPHGASLPAPTSTVAVGGGGFDGHLSLRNATGTALVEAEISHPQPPKSSGSLTLPTSPVSFRIGSMLAPGSLSVFSALGPKSRVEVSGSAPLAINFIQSDKTRTRIDGYHADLWLGGNGTHGDVVLFDDDGDNASPDQATVHIRARNPAVAMYVGGQPRARIGVGGNGAYGEVVLFKDGDNATPAADTIHLRGDTGDILLQNADCAEEFEVAATESVEAGEPGTVMVIDENGVLRPCVTAYDRRVAGVISGGADSPPGIVLGSKPGASDRRPIALVGRVFCKVDARTHAIETGDLLTTSETLGHAMKASDPKAAFGSVLGKALGPLVGRTGLIPILVTLQ